MISKAFFLFLMAVSLASVNCNGLRDKSKLVNMFSSFSLKKFDIICLQETFWDDYFVDSFVNFKWDGDIYLSNADNFRKGVAVLFNKNFDGKVLSAREIVKGRALELCIEIDDHDCYIYNIYAPCGFLERRLFFEKLNLVLGNNANCDYMVFGDFNCVSNQKDKSNPLFHDSSVKSYNDLVKSNFLVDIWRDQHPDTIEFTWRRNVNGKLIQSRIDRVLVSRSFKHFVSNSKIFPFTWSDHDLVYVRLDLSRVARGGGYWHFNKSLLNDEFFCFDIRHCISLNKHKESYVNDTLQWYEDLKADFKIISIWHSRRLAKERRKNIKKLQKAIKHEYKKAAKYVNYDLSLCKKLESDLHTIEVNICEGAIIRAKIKQIEEGEKSTKYFFNLEKFRQKSQTISRIVSHNDVVLNNSHDIIKESVYFYTNLFSGDNCTESTVQDSFVNNLSSKLNNDDVNICKVDISLDELKNAVFKMDSDKSPGSDGLTSAFYKYFLMILAQSS